MANNAIKGQLTEVKTLKMIAAAFSETSALKIKSLKEAFEENKLYYDEISQLYSSVKRTQLAIETIKQESAQQENKKTLHIAITSNHRFYGNLNQAIIRELYNKTKDLTEDTIIVGKTGIRAAGSFTFKTKYQTSEFEQDEPNKQEVTSLIDKTLGYDRVYVYYPKFISMFTQTADRFDITHTPPREVSQDREISYIFEPELSKIIAFFELNVRLILFYRVMLETDLARVATRLISMDAAERKSQEMIESLEYQITAERRARVNAELLETFSGMSKWGK